MREKSIDLSPRENRVMDRCYTVVLRQQKALGTERTYFGWITRYLAYLRGVDPTLPSEEKVGGFLSLIAEGGVAKSTQNQAFNALLWLYRDVLKIELNNIHSLRAKRGRRVRYSPCFSDTQKFLDAVEDSQAQPYRLITQMLYACGLRISECLELRIRDIDLAGRRIWLRACKHDKDRVIRIPPRLVEPLRYQIARATAVWEWDRRQSTNVPVAMPTALARKWPKAAYSRNWFYVFPAQNYCDHPRTGQRVRWRLHRAAVGKACRRAAERIGMDGILTPHCLRHAFASHVLERGGNIKDVADHMGHENINTTAGYIHGHMERVQSPFEVMEVRETAPLPSNVIAFQKTEPDVMASQEWAQQHHSMRGAA